MNIFVLDADPERAAAHHNDRHVCKGILEAAQMLSTAHVYLDGSATAKRRVPDCLRPCYTTHPCSTWARSSHEAYDWLHTLMGALLYQYTMRYGREHYYGQGGPGMRLSLFAQLSARPLGMPMGARPPFAQAMPQPYVRANPVEAYRVYYAGTFKRHLASWTTVGEPSWFEEASITAERIEEDYREYLVASGREVFPVFERNGSIL